MSRSVEATIEVDEKVHIRESIHLSHACWAIVTIIDEPDIPETAILSERLCRKNTGTGWRRKRHGHTFSRFDSSCYFSFFESIQ